MNGLGRNFWRNVFFSFFFFSELKEEKAKRKELTVVAVVEFAKEFATRGGVFADGFEDDLGAGAPVFGQQHFGEPALAHRLQNVVLFHQVHLPKENNNDTKKKKRSIQRTEFSRVIKNRGLPSFTEFFLLVSTRFSTEGVSLMKPAVPRRFT